jgi:hypothetical protein
VNAGVDARRNLYGNGARTDDCLPRISAQEERGGRPAWQEKEFNKEGRHFAKTDNRYAQTLLEEDQHRFES